MIMRNHTMVVKIYMICRNVCDFMNFMTMRGLPMKVVLRHEFSQRDMTLSLKKMRGSFIYH